MNENETKTYIAAGKYEAQSVAALRKVAAGRIAGYRSMRKADLVAALAAAEVTAGQRRAELRADGVENKEAFHKAVKDAETTAKATKAAKSTRKPKLRVATRCAVCQRRPVDRKTQGRDSTMCEPCYDYAGWENTHSDNGHEGQGDLPTTPKELLEEMAICPVCQGENPANEPARKTAQPKAHDKSKPAARKPGQTKGERFAEDAKANGWKVRREVDEKGHLEIVTAHAAGGEWLKIQWRDGSCLNTGTTHKRPDGKVVKVRNASAARKILEDA
jgi:hypothetical protein